MNRIRSYQGTKIQRILLVSQVKPFLFTVLAASFLSGFPNLVTAGMTYVAVSTYDEHRSGHRDEERQIDKRAGMGAAVYQGVFRIEIKAWVQGRNSRMDIMQSDDGTIPEGGSLVSNNAGESFFYLNPRNKTYTEWDFSKANEQLGKLGESINKLFKQKVGEVGIEQLEKKSGGEIAGYQTTYYRYRSAYETTAKIFGKSNQSKTIIDDELWFTEAAGDVAMLTWIKRRQPGVGDKESNEKINTRLNALPGLPLRIRTATRFTDKTGHETVYYSTLDVSEMNMEPVSSDTFEIPKDYRKTSMFKALMKP